MGVIRWFVLSPADEFLECSSREHVDLVLSFHRYEVLCWVGYEVKAQTHVWYRWCTLSSVDSVGRIWIDHSPDYFSPSLNARIEDHDKRDSSSLAGVGRGF